jgi:hypothetical protein
MPAKISSWQSILRLQGSGSLTADHALAQTALAAHVT